MATELNQLSGFSATGPHPVYLQVANFLRDRIARGTLTGGTRLPSVRNLATHWEVKESTVARALRYLGAEGILQCSPNVGNFVREQSAALTRVAIYSHIGHSHNPENDQFSRLLREALTVRLGRRNALSVIFLDERPLAEQVEPMPELIEAIRAGRIQELIVLESSYSARRWLLKLGVPTIKNGIDCECSCAGLDLPAMLSAAARQLARRGCRRVGMVSSITPNRLDPWRKSAFEMFQEESERLGMTVENAYLEKPDTDDLYENQAQFGYERTLRLLRLPTPPDGVFLHPDSTAAGAVAAVSAAGIPVPEKLKVVIHRNRQIALFTPFPADRLEYDVEELAELLINTLDERLRNNTPAAPRIWPFRVVADESPETQKKES